MSEGRGQEPDVVRTVRHGRDNGVARTSRHGRIGRQRQLPLRKAARMAWQSIRVRLVRSLLVTSGIVLAIAFLTYILCSDTLSKHVVREGPTELVEELRRKGKIVGPGVKSAPTTRRSRPGVKSAPTTRRSRPGGHREDEDAEVRSGQQRGPDAEGTLVEDAAALQSREDARIQTRWMVGLALLVSFVGILNAMLLSVTERFREIGTMKCLGALNGLVVELFLLESVLQGMVGTALGIVVGLVLTLTEGMSLYGAAVWSLLPAGAFAVIVGVSFASGTALTIAGALYPAWVAARMQPVEALRSEV